MKYLIYLITLLLLSSCLTEDEVIVYPLMGDYLPAYPNSYWNYRDSANEIVRYYTSDYYVVSACNSYQYNGLEDCEQNVSNDPKIYVTTIHGLGLVNIEGYKRIGSDAIGISPMPPCYFTCLTIMSDVIGHRWNITFNDPRYSRWNIYKEVILKNIMPEFNQFTSDSVVVVRQYKITWDQWNPDIVDSNFVQEYYGKDIGLMKRINITYPEREHYCCFTID